MKKNIKPWGYEKIVELNKNYLVKILFMKKNHRCSLQFHEFKKETIYVLNGKLKISLGNDKNNLKDKIFNTNDKITIEPSIIHRMEAIEDCTYLEASTPEIDDVVRLQDDYKRI